MSSDPNNKCTTAFKNRSFKIVKARDRKGFLPNKAEVFFALDQFVLKLHDNDNLERENAQAIKINVQV